MALLGGIKLPTLASDPTDSPSSGKVFIYTVGSEIRYKVSNGSVYTLATGVTPEDVQDIVGAFISAASNKASVVYNDSLNTLTIDVVESNINHQNLIGAGTNTHTQLDSHVASTLNPHSVTKTQVGLGNVDNTSDLDKIVSTAQALEFSQKVSKDPKMLYVNQNIPTKTGDFSSIAAAAASITDSDEDNQYVIKVSTGVYVEPLITLPEHVSIVGESIQGTIIEPDSLTHDCIQTDIGCEISDLTIRNVGTSYSAINSTNDGRFVIINRILIYSCGVAIKHIASTVDSYFYIGYVSIQAPYTNAIVCESSNGFSANLNAEGLYIYSNSGCGNAIVANGQYSNIFLKITELYGNTLEKAIEYNGGGNLYILSSNIENFNTSVHLKDGGYSSQIHLDYHSRSVTNDLLLENTMATGCLRGSLDNSKVFINDSAIIAANYSTHDNNGSVILGKILQGEKHSQLTDLSEIIRDNALIGVREGGTIAPVSGFTISIASGSGYVIDSTTTVLKKIEWNNTNITLNQKENLFVYVDNSGIVNTSIAKPVCCEVICLGSVQTDASQVFFVENFPVNIPRWTNTVEKYLREALGAVVASGIVTSEGAVSKQLNVSSGTYFFGTNKHEVVGASPITMNIVYRDGLGSYSQIASQVSLIADKYDDNSGTLANLPTGKFAKHTLYCVVGGNTTSFILMMGQQIFDTQIDAESGALPIPPPSFVRTVIPIATIVTSKDTNEIEAVIDSRPRIGFSPSVVSTIQSHGDLGELLDDDHPQYHNDTRGDARYYTQSQITTFLSGKADINHTHLISDITNFTEEVQDIVGTMIADSSSIDFTYNDVGNSITASVLPAGVNHDALQNFVANEHIDHSSVSISAGSGLTGGGDITASRTISMPNVGTSGTYGSASQVPVVTTDTQGRVSSATNTSIQIAETQVTNLTTDLAAKADKTTTISAGTGLSGGGDLSANRTLNIANTGVTAGTYGGTSGVPSVTVNAQGQISAISNGPTLVVGDNFERFEDLTAATTTSSTYNTAASFTTTTKQAGEYRISTQIRFSPHSTNNDFYFRVLVDGTQIGPEISEEAQDNASLGYVRHIWGYTTFAVATTHTITIQFRTENNASGTLTCSEAYTEMWRRG